MNSGYTNRNHKIKCIFNGDKLVTANAKKTVQHDNDRAKTNI